MKAESLQEKSSLLDQSVLIWSQLSDEENAAEKKARWYEILILFLEIYDRGKNKGQDIILKVFQDTIKRYTPSKGDFTHYYNKALKGRIVDTLEPPTISIHEPIPHTEGSQSQIDVIENKNADDPDLILAYKETTEEIIAKNERKRLDMPRRHQEFTAFILHFSRWHKGKSNTMECRLWYRLFFTEDMTVEWKKKDTHYAHEPDIFEAMFLPYLDYYMTQKCRCGGIRVAPTPLKRYGEVYPDCPIEDREKETPISKGFHQMIPICYLNANPEVAANYLGYNYKAAKNKRSRYHTRYKVEMDALKKGEDPRIAWDNHKKSKASNNNDN